MRIDAQRLIRVVLSIGYTKDLIPHEGIEPVLLDRLPIVPFMLIRPRGDQGAHT